MNGERKVCNVFGMSSLVLFVLGVVTFALIGVLVFRAGNDGSWLCRSEWFWCRLLWFEAIFALFWFAIFGLPFSKMFQERHMTGATHAIVATICLRASLVSFVIWCISSMVPVDTSFAILPVAIQLLVILYYGTVVLMFPKTQALQVDGMEHPKDMGLPSPMELSNRLGRIELELEMDAELMAVKRLKEKIRYSLPNVGRIATCNSYIQLVEIVGQMGKGHSTIEKSCREAEKAVGLIVESCKW